MFQNKFSNDKKTTFLFTLVLLCLCFVIRALQSLRLCCVLTPPISTKPLRLNAEFTFSPLLRTLLFFVAFLAVGCLPAFQNTVAQSFQPLSPFTRLGIGAPLPTQFSVNRGMGGLAYGYRSAINVNHANPASYANIKLTTLETALYADGKWLSDGENTHKTGTAGLGYFAFGFPAAKFWGLSVGLIPFSGISYDVLDKGNITATGDTLDFRYKGDGTWYQVYIGNGFDIKIDSTKKLSVGLNIGYVFGTIEREIRESFPALENSIGTHSVETLSARDFVFHPGLQYRQSLKNGMTYTLGAVCFIPNKLNLKRDYWWGRSVITETNSFPIDTILESNNQKNNVNLPLRIGGGFTLGSKDWLAGADVTWENYEKLELFGEADVLAQNALQFSAGVSFTTKDRKPTNAKAPPVYRFGFNYSTGRYKINGNSLSEYGVTAGIGLNISRLGSQLNLSLQAGQRGSLLKHPVRETFLQTTIGITLNDKWFIKRKFH